MCERNKTIALWLLAVLFNTELYGQHQDSIILTSDKIKSSELLDYFRFEEVDYDKLAVTGIKIKDHYFILTGNEYWNGKLVKSDTIVNAKKFGIKNRNDTININVLAKKNR